MLSGGGQGCCSSVVEIITVRCAGAHCLIDSRFVSPSHRVALIYSLPCFSFSFFVLKFNLLSIASRIHVHGLHPPPSTVYIHTSTRSLTRYLSISHQRTWIASYLCIDGLVHLRSLSLPFSLHLRASLPFTFTSHLLALMRTLVPCSMFNPFSFRFFSI